MIFAKEWIFTITKPRYNVRLSFKGKSNFSGRCIQNSGASEILLQMCLVIMSKTLTPSNWIWGLLLLIYYYRKIQEVKYKELDMSRGKESTNLRKNSEILCLGNSRWAYAFLELHTFWFIVYSLVAYMISKKIIFFLYLTSLICTTTTTAQTIHIALTLPKEKGRESDVFAILWIWRT